jgi:hypothetical protein
MRITFGEAIAVDKFANREGVIGSKLGSLNHLTIGECYGRWEPGWQTNQIGEMPS